MLAQPEGLRVTQIGSFSWQGEVRVGRVTKNSEVSENPWLLGILREFECEAKVSSSFPCLVSVVIALG